MARLSFGLWGYRFKTDDTYITYRSAYGQGFKVRKADISTVTTDTAKGLGKGKLRLIGSGTTLAEVTLPRTWVEKAQAFILGELERVNRGS